MASTAVPSPLREQGDAVFRVRDLHVSFERNRQTIRALRGVSLDVHRGEILGLVGESGSGKSVLGLTLLGLLSTTNPPHVEGSVEVLGTDMLKSPKDVQRRLRRKSLGAVFQDPMTSLNPTMRVGKQIMEVAGSEAEASRLLEAVGVSDAKSRLRAYPHELSGGQRQRVMIAMAVAGDPALVVADEPTTALDVTVQAQVLDLIRRLRDDVGCSFLFITHDLGVAAQVADRIAVLYGGRVMEIASGDQLLGAPAHPYSIGLLRSRLNMGTERERPLVTLRGEPPDPRAHPPGCPFAPRCAWHMPECDVEPPPLERHGATEAACIRLEVVEADSHHPPHTPAWPEEIPRTDAPMRVEGLRKSFRVRVGHHRERLEALRGIDLEVRPGESVALVGESGCGKSTLLRVVAGLLEADEGRVTLPAGEPPQMVFQDAGASLTPWLTVGDQVGERIREVRRQERTKRTDEALRLVGLPSEVARAKPLQLSGGQRQRVALARAVVVPPPLLLCDEPTSSLDVSLAAVVLNLIGRLRRELGLSVLFVTHDLAAARIVADRIAVMYLGEIVEIGPADEVAASPAHPYTKALVAAVPDVGARRPPVKGEPASPLKPPSGCPYHPRCVEALEVCQTELQPLTEFGEGNRAAACVHVREAANGSR